MNQRKPIRQRRCIVCGKQAGKAQLQRIVRPKEGPVAYDATGKAAGRGAYVCSAECLATALKTKKLERALRTKLDQAIASQIEADVTSALRESQGTVEE